MESYPVWQGDISGLHPLGAAITAGVGGAGHKRTQLLSAKVLFAVHPADVPAAHGVAVG